jgi:sugar-specific transcriptional regulator TrmB
MQVNVSVTHLGGCALQEDFVKKLSEFGLTTNQAKVYLSIIQAGSISAGNISKVSLLHRQDIYKILPILEKKGLITKTIAKPCKIQAIPLETALYQLILNEKEKSNKKIFALESNLNTLVEALKVQPKIEEDKHFTLLTTIESIRNRADFTIRTLKKEVKFAANTELMFGPVTKLNEILDLLTGKQIKLSLLVTPIEGLDTVRKVIDSLNQSQSRVTIKGISNGKFKNYIIADRREVWIQTEQKTESGFPGILWTNDKNVVQVYEENFDINWNNSNTITVNSKAVRKSKPVTQEAITP